MRWNIGFGHIDMLAQALLVFCARVAKQVDSEIMSGVLVGVVVRKERLAV